MPQVFFSIPTCFLVAWTLNPPEQPGQPDKWPLTIFLEEKSHVRMRLGLFLPTVNFDQLSNLKTSFVEVVPYPFVFSIIEVTGQGIQVIIDTFKVFLKEKHKWL